MVDSQGNVLDQIDYDAFGNVTAETNPSYGALIKFTGQQYDATTGLYYERARWYDPRTGTWTTEDPSGFGAGDANLYRTVGNDPTNETDPSGLWSFGSTAQWTWDVGSSFVLGGYQGGLNVYNGLTDIPTGLGNAIIWVGNHTVGQLPGASTRRYLEGWDWSNGLLVQEDPTLHAASKAIGAIGVTLPLTQGLQWAELLALVRVRSLKAVGRSGSRLQVGGRSKPRWQARALPGWAWHLGSRGSAQGQQVLGKTSVRSTVRGEGEAARVQAIAPQRGN